MTARASASVSSGGGYAGRCGAGACATPAPSAHSSNTVPIAKARDKAPASARIMISLGSFNQLGKSLIDIRLTLHVVKQRSESVQFCHKGRQSARTVCACEPVNNDMALFAERV